MPTFVSSVTGDRNNGDSAVAQADTKQDVTVQRLEAALLSTGVGGVHVVATHNFAQIPIATREKADHVLAPGGPGQDVLA